MSKTVQKLVSTWQWEHIGNVMNPLKKLWRWLLKKLPICVKCDCKIIDECGVFDGPNGPLCRGCHAERFER